jgi:hypothetical protein
MLIYSSLQCLTHITMLMHDVTQGRLAKRPARFLTLMVPAGLETFFEEMGKVRLTATHSLNNTSSSPARIIIADGHELARESMRIMLQREPDLQIIDEAKDGQQTIELCRLQRPDLVLMDVTPTRSPTGSRSLRPRSPTCSVAYGRWTSPNTNATVGPL